MKYSPFAVISSLSLLFCSAPVTGQNIYRWTDPQGRIHFSNAPVHEAKAIDDELPPATNFGGEPGSIPFAVRQPPSAKEKPVTPPAPAKAAPSETVGEDSTAQVNNEEAQAAERMPVTGIEKNPAVPSTQTDTDLSQSDNQEEKPKKDTPSNKNKPVPSDEDADDDNGGDDDSGVSNDPNDSGASDDPDDSGASDDPDDSGASDDPDDSHDKDDEDEPEATKASAPLPAAFHSVSLEGKIFIFS